MARNLPFGYEPMLTSTQRPALPALPAPLPAPVRFTNELVIVNRGSRKGRQGVPEVIEELGVACANVVETVAHSHATSIVRNRLMGPGAVQALVPRTAPHRWRLPVARVKVESLQSGTSS